MHRTTGGGLFVLLAQIIVLAACWSGRVHGQEAPPDSTVSQNTRKVDFLLSGHVFGLLPRDKDLSVNAERIAGTDVRGIIGAGIKFDIYPGFTNRILGAEIEASVFGGSMRAPRTTSGTGTTQAQGNLIALSTMYNLMLRYPGNVVQPYLGVGAGSSSGILYDANVQSRNAGLSGTSMDLAFAYQFLGGVRAFVNQRMFLFSEYKYFVTEYSWRSAGAGNPKVKLDFQTHIVSGGVGWSF